MFIILFAISFAFRLQFQRRHRHLHTHNHHLVSLSLPAQFREIEFVADFIFEGLPYKMLIDSGSSVPTAKAKGCRGLPQKKMRIQKLDCLQDDQLRYGDGRIKGKVCTVNSQFDNISVPLQMTLFDECDQSFQTLQGILGLEWTHQSLGEQLYQKGLIDKRVLTIWATTQGGYLNYGSLESDQIQQSEISYAPVQRSFRIELKGMRIGKVIRELQQSALIDTGTTDLTLSPQLGQFVIDQFAKAGFNTCKFQVQQVETYSELKCYGLQRNQLHQLPQIAILMDKQLTIKPADYLAECSDDPAGVLECSFGIEVSEYGGLVLGLTVLKNHAILIDIENKRLGLARKISQKRV